MGRPAANDQVSIQHRTAPTKAQLQIAKPGRFAAGNRGRLSQHHHSDVLVDEPHGITIDGLEEVATALGAGPRTSEPVRAATWEFVLEGLCALKKISRSEDGRFHQPARTTKPQERNLQQMLEDDDDTAVRGKKKYYN